MNTSFVYLLWSETKLSILGEPSIIVRFINWVDCKWVRGFFCLYIIAVLFSIFLGLITLIL